jgi:DNA-binding NtrC family response regulator
VHPSAIDKMRRHPWNGNVRELENIVTSAYRLANEGLILPDHVVFRGDRGAAPGEERERSAPVDGAEVVDAVWTAKLRRQQAFYDGLRSDGQELPAEELWQRVTQALEPHDASVLTVNDLFDDREAAAYLKQKLHYPAEPRTVHKEAQKKAIRRYPNGLGRPLLYFFKDLDRFAQVKRMRAAGRSA